MLILGGPGRGKSTLVTRLYARGWQYLSDDLVAIDPVSSRVQSIPETPAFRPIPGFVVSEDEVDTLPKVVVEIAAERICREPVLLGALLFPRYRPSGPTEILPRRSGEAAMGLLEQCLELPTCHQIAVPYLAGLVRRVPAFDLPYDDGGLAAELIIHQLGRLGPSGSSS